MFKETHFLYVHVSAFVCSLYRVSSNLSAFQTMTVAVIVITCLKTYLSVEICTSEIRHCLNYVEGARVRLGCH